MKTFSTVEDYIEVIGGWRDPVTNATPNSNTLLWFSFNPIISLARYDVSVLDSMCTSAVEGKALTERQGELAVKIISKYKRQLAQKGIDIAPVENPVWRNTLRVMDYSRKMKISDDKIMIEFPFKTELIDGLREFRKDSQGHGEWNKDKKRWEFALTEYNLEYLKTWCESNQFEIDQEVIRLHGLVDQVEQVGFAIELDVIDENLTIHNASQSLLEFINENCGGLSFDNLAKLIDMAPVLGYSVSEDVLSAWKMANDVSIISFSTNRELKVNTEKYRMQDVLASVVKYAELTERYPIVLFEPDTTNKLLNTLSGIVDPKEIYTQRGKHTKNSVPSGVKYIHTTIPIRDMTIPLLVSTAGMMFGGDKSLMTQHTEKAIYFAHDVYTNKKEYKVPDFEGEFNNP